MPINQKLQLHQFEVNKENILDLKIYIYKWPEKLIRMLTENNSHFKMKVPVKNLSEIITMTLDDVIYTKNKVKGNQFWIYAFEKINLNVVTSTIAEWLVANDINSINYEDVVFEEPDIIGSHQLFESEFKFDVYNIIPHLYNAEFCKDKIEIDSINRVLNFFPVIDSERESVAISEPLPHTYNKDSIEKYSYAITFRLVNNVEIPDKLFLNIYTGIKVWACKPLIKEGSNFISGKHANSYYFYVENDYTRNLKQKLIKVMYERNNKYGFNYKNYSDRVLSKQMSLKFTKVLMNPNEFNSFNDGCNEKIYLITNYNKSEKVKYGAGLPERIDIFKLIQNIFPGLYKRKLVDSIIGRGKDVSKRKQSLKELNQFSYNQDELEFIEEGDKFFYNSPPVFIPKNDKVIIEIYSENQELVNAFIELSVRILSLNMPVDKYTYRSCDGFEVEFVPRDNKICRELNIDELENKKLRIEEITQTVGSNKYNTCHILSFLDIYAFQTKDNETKRRDPKNIIRTALKDTGRVSQFINEFNPKEAESKIKLLNATYDLFSAAGFMEHNYIKNNFSDKILLGLSTIKNTRGKMVALSKIDKGQITYKMYGIWDEKWLSINELLPKLQWYKVNQILKREIDKIHFNDWIVNELNNLQTASKDCYFFFDASLRYKHWPFARNSDLDISNLRIVKSERFKFIRVNTSSEVPEYNIFKDENDVEGINRNKGLFSTNDKVFYSVGSRPDTNQIKTTATRLTHTTKMITKQRIVEFVIFNNEGNDNQQIAIESHILRKLNLTFDAATKYPLPLYLNNRFSEYLYAMGIK